MDNRAGERVMEGRTMEENRRIDKREGRGSTEFPVTAGTHQSDEHPVQPPQYIRPIIILRPGRVESRQLRKSKKKRERGRKGRRERGMVGGREEGKEGEIKGRRERDGGRVRLTAAHQVVP